MEDRIQPTPVAEIKGRFTKIVQSPTTGLAYRIRPANALDFAVSGLAAMLRLKPGALRKDARTLTAGDLDLSVFEDRAGDYLMSLSKLVSRCVVDPKIKLQDGAIDDPDVLHISEIGGDEIFLWSEISTLSGATEEAAEEVEAAAKNGNGPGSSMNSPEPTDDFPTKS